MAEVERITRLFDVLRDPILESRRCGRDEEKFAAGPPPQHPGGTPSMARHPRQFCGRFAQGKKSLPERRMLILASSMARFFSSSFLVGLSAQGIAIVTSSDAVRTHIGSFYSHWWLAPAPLSTSPWSHSGCRFAAHFVPGIPRRKRIRGDSN